MTKHEKFTSIIFITLTILMVISSIITDKQLNDYIAKYKQIQQDKTELIQELRDKQNEINALKSVIESN